MSVRHAGHPGKEQNVPSRIYLWLNQLYLKGIIFQIVLLLQAGSCSNSHLETREARWFKVFQIQVADNIILSLISQCCTVFMALGFLILQDPARIWHEGII
jgi:hypothetical protein